MTPAPAAGAPVDVIAVVATPFGGSKFGWLKMLKNSARNWTRSCSFRVKFFIKDMSKVLNSGPSMELRAALPNVYRSASAYADALNDFFGSRWLRGKFGLPMGLGR